VVKRSDDHKETTTMAQYLINVLTDSTDLATDEEMAAIDVFNSQMQTDGTWVFAAGLAGPANATVVDARTPEAVVTDGPFLESKEFIIGFWIIEAPHLDVALKLAAAGSKACNRRVELRPVL
jgi:hypothetical protein